MASYWHNIGKPDLSRDWTQLWRALRENGVVTAGYGNVPLGKGHEVVARYGAGDRILAYANGYGLVGIGIARGAGSAIRRDTPRNGSNHQHEAQVEWRDTLELDEAIPAAEVLAACGLRHPRQTSERISDKQADAVDALIRRRCAGR